MKATKAVTLDPKSAKSFDLKRSEIKKIPETPDVGLPLTYSVIGHRLLRSAAGATTQLGVGGSDHVSSFCHPLLPYPDCPGSSPRWRFCIAGSFSRASAVIRSTTSPPTMMATSCGAGNNSFNAKSKVPGTFFDAIPGNLIFDQNGNGGFFDLEWQFKKPVEVGWIYSRGMRDSFFSLDLVERDKQPCTFNELTCLIGAKIGIDLSTEELDVYLSQEQDFQEAVTRFPLSKENKNHLLPIRPRESAFDRLIKNKREKAKNAGKTSAFLSRLLRKT